MRKEKTHRILIVKKWKLTIKGERKRGIMYEQETRDTYMASKLNGEEGK
jgi:hypothetical protein